MSESRPWYAIPEFAEKQEEVALLQQLACRNPEQAIATYLSVWPTQFPRFQMCNQTEVNEVLRRCLANKKAMVAAK